MGKNLAMAGFQLKTISVRRESLVLLVFQRKSGLNVVIITMSMGNAGILVVLRIT